MGRKAMKVELNHTDLDLLIIALNDSITQLDLAIIDTKVNGNMQAHYQKERAYIIKLRMHLSTTQFMSHKETTAHE